MFRGVRIIKLRKVAERAALRRTNALWDERRRGVLPMKRYALNRMCQCFNVSMFLEDTCSPEHRLESLHARRGVAQFLLSRLRLGVHLRPRR